MISGKSNQHRSGIQILLITVWQNGSSKVRYVDMPFCINYTVFMANETQHDIDG